MMRLVPPVFLLALVIGCAFPSTLPSATGLNPAATKVVIIGKFELVPALEPELEQDTHWNLLGDRRILNKVVMATGADFTPVATNPLRLKDWKNSIEAEWNVPFMVEAPRQRTWLRGAMTQLDLVNRDRLWFPGGVYFDVPSDAEAIYIGTLRYIRDDFNNIIRVQILDEFESAIVSLRLGANYENIEISLLIAPE